MLLFFITCLYQLTPLDNSYDIFDYHHKITEFI